MKGLLKFFQKVKRNPNNLYYTEKMMMMGIEESFWMTIVTLVLLGFPWGRAILKWFTYISVFVAGMGACGVLFENIHTFYAAYKYDKYLEKTGTTREEIALKRKQACEAKEN